MWNSVHTLWSRTWGWFLIACALVVGGFYYADVQAQGERAECQAQYNTALAQQLIIRSSLFQEADDARDHVIRGVGRILDDPPPRNVEESEAQAERFREIFTTYAAEADALDAQRDAVKLPPIPDC